MKKLSLRNARMETFLERAIDGFGQLAMHEADALDGHLDALRERLAVARKARGLGELLRDQFDLIPSTRARFTRDHETRLRLLRELKQGRDAAA